MEIISILICAGILLIVAYLVYFYADKSVKIHIKLLTYFSWLLSFGFVFLVPIDIYFVNFRNLMLYISLIIYY